MSVIEIVALMEFVLIVLLGTQCHFLSRRIDIVHKRVTHELHANGLRSLWAEIEAEDTTDSLFKRLRRRALREKTP